MFCPTNEPGLDSDVVGADTATLTFLSTWSCSRVAF